MHIPELVGTKGQTCYLKFEQLVSISQAGFYFYESIIWKLDINHLIPDTLKFEEIQKEFYH